MQQVLQKKEDLRVLRTRQKIYRCFLDLRRKKPIEEIRITDLCEKAGINRATFYHHYQDIYALSDEMENTVIERYQQKLTKDDIDMFFSEPKIFLHTLENVINSERADIEILASGRKADRMDCGCSCGPDDKDRHHCLHRRNGTGYDEGQICRLRGGGGLCRKGKRQERKAAGSGLFR